MPAALALLASVTWGIADFLGGALSRRLPTVLVLRRSQIAGLVCIGVVLALGGWRAPGAYLWWGVAGSASGTIAGAALYRALAIGTMSVVAPIAGTGLLVPVLVGLVMGERPTALQLVGIGLATAGVVLASGPELKAIDQQRQAVLLALLAAVGLGAALTAIPRAGEDRWAMTTAVVTLTGFAMTSAFAAITRTHAPLPIAREALGALAIGVLNVLSLGLYSYASTRGLVAVVAVLASLYPAVTVVLAHVIFRERLQGIQLAGVLAVFLGTVPLVVG